MERRGGACPRWKCLNVDEYLLPTLCGLQEAEAALVLPGLEGSGESHAVVCICAAYGRRNRRCLPFWRSVRYVAGLDGIIRPGGAVNVDRCNV